MEIKVLSPLWGHEQLEYKMFLDKMRMAGYDGFDTWVPEDAGEKKLLFDYLQTHQMYIVTHQHQAAGKNFTEFKSSFKKNLYRCAEPEPLLINSHTGRDYFSLEQNLELIDIAGEFSEKTGITVAHETHRGRVGYSPQMLAELFELRKDLFITADFSHWVCVTESMLQHFSGILTEAIGRSRHIHARVGFEQGSQVPHPAAPEWQYAVDHFFSWWDRIIKTNVKNNCKLMPVTTEFGPQPYMPSLPFSNKPVADQFEINCYMKDMIRKRYTVSQDR
jgi:hypothetical protein